MIPGRGRGQPLQSIPGARRIQHAAEHWHGVAAAPTSGREADRRSADRWLPHHSGVEVVRVDERAAIPRRCACGG